MSADTTLQIEGRSVGVRNLNKVFYPETGFTKGAVIDYYIRIAPVLLPHLASRPVSLKRYPHGVDELFFYEKRCPSNRPKWMKTARVPKKEGGDINYCLINDLPALVWAANMANLELHTFLHRAPALQRPSFLAFDLDPGPPATIVECFGVALLLRRMFDALGLKCFAKTSGSKGLQLYVPLNSKVTYDRTKAFARTAAELLETRVPDLIVSRMSKSLRKGKVFIDWSQNDDKKTTATVYTLRAKSTPTVSTPLQWKEVELACRGKKSLSFTTEQVLRRVKKHGDLFAPVLTMEQILPAAEEIEAVLE